MAYLTAAIQMTSVTFKVIHSLPIASLFKREFL